MPITLSGQISLQGNVSAQSNIETSVLSAFAVAQGTNRGIYTTNGTTWTETTLPASRIWLKAAYNPKNAGRASAVGWGGTAYSTDSGQTWSAGSGMTSADVDAVAPVTSTVWIIVSNSVNQYWKSTNNGQTWTQTTFPTGSVYNGRDVAGAGDSLAVVVRGQLGYYTTTDGDTFTARTLPTPPGGTNNFSRIRYSNGVYFAMENTTNRYIMTSTDGINWSTRDVRGTAGSTSDSFRDVAYGNGTWMIACDLSSAYYTSTDLSTWTRLTMPASRRWSGVAYLNNQWVMIVDGESDNIKAVSSDGVNWTESALTISAARWQGLEEVI